MIDPVSILGYSKGSPYAGNPYLDIHSPEGLIDMSQTPIDLVGVDNKGNKKVMKAGSKNPYRFEGDVIRETPMQYGGDFGFLFDEDKKAPKETSNTIPQAPIVSHEDQKQFFPARMSVPTQTNDKAKYAFDFFKTRGLTDYQSAGIVANLIQESGNFRGDVISGHTTGDNNLKDKAYGIAQWRGARLKSLQNFAKQNDMDPFTLDAQLNFVEHEAKQRGDWNKLLGTKDLGEATHSFNYNYEVSADSRNPKLRYFRTKHVLDSNGNIKWQ